MKIKEIMNQGVISVDEKTTPIEAFEKMYKNGVRRLFVVDDKGMPTGVITHTNLLDTLNQLGDSPKGNKNIKVTDIMSTNVITINAQESIKNAANLMLRADVSGLLAIDAKKPVGVITKTDICRLVAANLLVPK
ncbi:MAG: CBS domain-containing protein [Methanobacteriaceae archaeon]|jgi:predicted transcriptional regulator|nr:CBS domain-containing protein [Candidatus Methanorudis spinitermitis]